MSRKKTQPKKNVIPDPKFNSTIIPIEPSLNGPNTKEIPKNTSPIRDIGKKSFLQKASSNEAAT